MTESTKSAVGGENEVGFLLSSQQERLWSLYGEAVPQSQCAFELTGPLDPESMRQALEAAVSRHEILRTAFVRPAGLRMPLQVVQGEGSVSWTTTDLDAADEAEWEQRLAGLRREQIERPIDLERGPLLQAGLLRKEGRQVLVLSAPSIVLDARSLELLARECLADAPADAEPLQYGDYAAWQQEQREGIAVDTDATPTVLPLAERPLATVGEEKAELVVPIDADAAAAIERLGGESRETWFALWSVLVGRLTGDHELKLNVALDGRAQEELADALGPFARSVLVSVEIEAGASFAEVLNAVGAELRSVERDQERSSQAPTGPAVSFSFSSEPKPFASGDLTASLLEASGHDDVGQIGLEVRSRAGGVEAVLHYRADAFTAADVQRIGQHLQALVSAIAAGGDSLPVAQLEVLSAEQRHQLLDEFSGQGVSVAAEQCAHWRIEGAAARVPDAVAVGLGEDSLSYAQLNERANRIAHGLRTEGVGPGTTVSILLDRSLDLIVSVLAVMKSGAAYLPLNPDHPSERLRFQMQDAGSALVLTDGTLIDDAAALPGSATRVDEGFAEQPVTNPERVNSLDDVVYLIYTSGSTGVPKGVEVTHRGLSSYLSAIADRIAIGDGAEALRFGVVTTISTDLGNTSVFSALASGACLELVPVEAAMDGEAFAAHLADRPLDLLKITPSHLTALLASDQAGVLPRRWLILGGEAAPWSLLEQVRARSECAIVNHYGPTETTIGSLTYDVEARDGAAAPAATVPIGRPLAGTEIYVVDEQLQPVPIGAPGELLIAGSGLARGYRSQPDQTAERFLPHPFSAGSDARVYRTGDVVRFLTDGNVEFLGRADGQVKIRGFRVELTEIEAILSADPGVSQVAVTMREESSGDKRLVAYVVGEATHDELRALARDRLPDYMIPAAFVSLEVLPLTANGKLDRSALPAPDMAMGAASEYVAPSTEVEEGLVKIWAEALEIERVGVQDDFFELGGHSLLAAQVIARIRSAYDVQLPLHSLFTAPRIADLAAEVEAAREPSKEDDAELSSLLEDLEGLSDEEAERLLALETSGGEGQPPTGSD